ncbi:acyltransferase family protein [Vibrio maerlii]|uniref:acyltransferase family protein n=1 Tax=Vibrio maerlii TaxID=2231648 RepID=UPI000E3D31AC|nr:acyltransferase [Vibrio maerlii]
MEQRKEWVDIAKAIGIVLVVYGHGMRGLEKAGIWTNKDSFVFIDSLIYSFHMPLFFFLSGLFIYDSLERKGKVSFLRSKLDTIFYPYLLWSILQGSIEVALSNYTNGSVDFQAVFSFLWAPRAQFWFLYALFFISIISMLMIGNRTRLYVWSALCLGAYLTGQPDLLNLHYVTDNMVFLMLGVVFSRLQSNTLPNYATFISLLTFGVLYYLSGTAELDSNISINLSEFVLAISGITVVLSISQQLSKHSHPVLEFIGRSSMAIYLMHILAGSGVRVLLAKILHIQDIYVHAFLGTVLGIILPLIGLIVIKKLAIPFVFSAPMSQILISPLNLASSHRRAQ